jgi:hypothetical protein
MRISSTIAEYQINEFIEILRKNKIKKGSDEWIKHLVMFGESRANANIGASFNQADFLVAYKEYWRLK